MLDECLLHFEVLLLSNTIPFHGYMHVFCRILARSGLSLTDKLPGEGITLGEALMAPTVIYVKQVNCQAFHIIMGNVIIFTRF